MTMYLFCHLLASTTSHSVSIQITVLSNTHLTPLAALARRILLRMMGLLVRIGPHTSEGIARCRASC